MCRKECNFFINSVSILRGELEKIIFYKKVYIIIELFIFSLFLLELLIWKTIPEDRVIFLYMFLLTINFILFMVTYRSYKRAIKLFIYTDVYIEDISSINKLNITTDSYDILTNSMKNRYLEMLSTIIQLPKKTIDDIISHTNSIMVESV